MATDPMLVQGARALAQSKIPKITGQKFDISFGGQLQQAITGGMAGVAQAYQNKNKADHKERENQIAAFTKTADAINRRLSTWEQGGKEAGMHEQIYNNTYDHIQELKTEYENADYLFVSA